MATSGTVTFAPTLVDIFEEAFERATGDELRYGYQVRSMRRSLNLLLLDWQNRGYNLWQLAEGTVDTVIGEKSISLEDDVVDIIEVLVANQDGSEYAIERRSVPDYAAIPNKDTAGRPSTMLVRRESAPVTVTLWPVPDRVYTVNYWYLRRAEDAGTGGNDPDVPIRFMPALIAGLAFYIGQKTPASVPILPFLEQQYGEAMKAAQSEDREKATHVVVPIRGYQRR